MTPLLAEQESPKLLLQTVQDCKAVGATGGRRAHAHTPWGRLTKGPLPAPSVCRPCVEKEDAGLGFHRPRRPLQKKTKNKKTVKDCTRETREG